MAADALPSWPAGTAAVLCVAGPHAIPISTALRAGDTRAVLALAHRRLSLARLRDDPACTLCVLAPGVAFSAEGNAFVVRERMRASDRVAALEVRVARLHDHLADGRTEILDAPRWRWRDAADEERDGLIRAELAEL